MTRVSVDELIVYSAEVAHDMQVHSAGTFIVTSSPQRSQVSVPCFDLTNLLSRSYARQEGGATVRLTARCIGNARLACIAVRAKHKALNTKCLLASLV